MSRVAWAGKNTVYASSKSYLKLLEDEGILNGGVEMRQSGGTIVAPRDDIPAKENGTLSGPVQSVSG